MVRSSGSRSHGRGVAEDAAIDEAKGRAATLLDSALLRKRDGVAPGDAELDACSNAFAALFALLSRRNDGVENWRFADDDRVSLYVEALKLTALGHPEHNAWHVTSTLRRHVLEGILARLRKGEDRWLRLCAVTAALASNSLEYALDSYARIADDPFLSRLAVRWANQAVIAFSFCNDVADYEAFLERTPHEDGWNVGAAAGRALGPARVDRPRSERRSTNDPGGAGLPFVPASRARGRLGNRRSRERHREAHLASHDGPPCRGPARPRRSQRRWRDARIRRGSSPGPGAPREPCLGRQPPRGDRAHGVRGRIHRRDRDREEMKSSMGGSYSPRDL